MNTKLLIQHVTAILLVVAGILMPSCACSLEGPIHVRVLTVILLFPITLLVASIWAALSFAFRAKVLYSAVVFFALSLVVSFAIFTYCHLKETPTGRFKELLISPVPQSVKMIEYSKGVRDLKRRQEACAFIISPTDFSFLASTCSFSGVNPASIDSAERRWYVLGLAYKYTNQFRINPSLFYYKDLKFMSNPNGDPHQFWFLMANKATNRAMVYYYYEN